MPILRIWDEESQVYQEIAALVGPQGPAGADGAAGEQGAAGPNEVSASTDSAITGLLKGANGKVAQAVAGEDYAEVSHTQAASTITAGTLAGQVVANSAGQSPSTSLLRNSKLVSTETAPTVNGEICWTYE